MLFNLDTHIFSDTQVQHLPRLYHTQLWREDRRISNAALLSDRGKEQYIWLLHGTDRMGSRTALSQWRPKASGISKTPAAHASSVKQSSRPDTNHCLFQLFPQVASAFNSQLWRQKLWSSLIICWPFSIKFLKFPRPSQKIRLFLTCPGLEKGALIFSQQEPWKLGIKERHWTVRSRMTTKSAHSQHCFPTHSSKLCQI